MNRHERRRLKKNNKLNTAVNVDLINGIKFHTNRNYVEAEKLYKKVLVSNPSNYDALRHLGILYQDQKNYAEAYEYFMQALKSNSRGFEVLSNLGTIHLNNKNYDLAVKCFNKSLEINNNYVPAINNLAGYYHKSNKPKKAMSLSSLALELQPNNPMAKNQYAKALVINNKLDEAIKLFQELNKDYPENDDFKFNLYSAYKENGEFEKANKIASEDFDNNFKKLPYLLSFTGDNKNKLKIKHIEYYDTLLEKNDVTPEDKIVICHSLFGYFKNNKDFDKAGKYLVRGNKSQYELKEFNLEKEEQYFNKIKKIFSKKLSFKVNKKFQGPMPIFVCGMPRSGTTLCEQILSSHSKINGAGELSYLAEESGINNLICPSEKNIGSLESVLQNNNKLSDARGQYLERLSAHGGEGAEYICDKMPHNFILIGLIKLILPESKIIYCKRDPIDNCFSLYSHKFLELSHQYSYNQKVLVQYYKMHEQLMNFWMKKFENDIFVLDNEELVYGQEKVSKQLLNFCDLKWEKNCLEFYKTKRQVRTASIEQVRNPINKKSIGAWKKYQNYLSEMVNEFN
mgnify:FL=1|tara:strand:+ start:6282 stop:7988 length:1707 start_codon:yes stop_codon:yes gene_type:complete